MASPGETYFRCRYDHIARSTCCCDVSRSASDRGMASSDCCCDVETFELVQAAPQPGSQLTGTAATVAEALTFPVYQLERPSEPAHMRVEQRNRNGPPVVLLSHSFRI